MIGLFLITAVLLVYWQVQYFDFVGFDDELYVTKNRQVQAGLTYRGFLWAFATTQAANWHPLTWLSHMLDSHLYGLNPAGHHWTNLLFHMANSLILFYLFQKITGATWRSAVVAGLFALHPLHVESVAWVAERKDVLSTFFGFLSIAAYSRYTGTKRLLDYLLCMLLLGLGLMAKPMLVTFPFLFLLLDFWPLNRFQGEGNAEQQPGLGSGSGGRRILPLVVEKIPLLVPVFLSCITTIMAQSSKGAVQTLQYFPFHVRIANALVAYATYIAKAFWPRRLSVYYPHPGNLPPLWKVFGAVLLVAGLTALSIRMLKKYPYVAVGWFWFLGTLVPVIGLVQVGTQAMADRYTYIPLTGIFIVLSWGARDLLSKRHWAKPVFIAGSCIILALLSLETRIQAGHWKNGVTLFEHAVRLNPRNSLGHNNLAAALHAGGSTDRAVFHFKEALKIAPEDIVARTNLAVILYEQGKFEEVGRHLREVLRLDSEYTAARYHLGILAWKRKNAREALYHFARLIRTDPGFGKAYYQIGVVLAQQGNLEKARAFLSRAVQIDPGNIQARKQLEYIREIKKLSESGRSDINKSLLSPQMDSNQ